MQTKIIKFFYSFKWFAAILDEIHEDQTLCFHIKFEFFMKSEK